MTRAPGRTAAEEDGAAAATATDKSGPGFTPGPWETCGDAIRTKLLPRDQRTALEHAGIEVARASFYLSEWRANAALLAAAPEMYEALRDVVARFDPDGSDVECPGLSEAEVAVLRRARRALAKAEGR